MDSKQHVKCSLTNRWGDRWLPFRYFFGEGWTIATINRGPIGREIHVMSEVPLRKIATEIMNAYNCDWYTTIHEDNQKAHNLAIKCGFEVINYRNKTNIYKRCKNGICR